MVLDREFILKVIVGVHFVCTSMILLTDWLPMSYTVNQIAILILGLWAIVHHESVVQVELLMLIKFFSIFLDIIAIGMYFKLGRDRYYGANYSSYFVLSAFFTLLLLVNKPLMLLLLNKVRQERVGDGATPTFGQWGLGGGYVPGYIPVDQQQTQQPQQPIVTGNP